MPPTPDGGGSTTLHFATCTLCEATCGVAIATRGPEVVSIRGDDDDPFSRGHICPKAAALADIHRDPDRLRRPLRREGSSWHEIPWRQALDEAAGRLRAVQERFGHDAVAVYLGNPNVHSLGAMLSVPGFTRRLRTKNRYSATSVDQLPHHLAAFLMFGHQLLLPVPDIDRTQHFLVFGANPVVSNGSLMTAPGVEKRLRDIRERGGSVVVIDPRRTETAAIATAHHFIRPGTDALVLMAMLHTVFAEGLKHPGRCEEWLTGLTQLKHAARTFPPERVEAASGLSASTIRSLARDFARAERAVCYGRIGISTQTFGSLACWLVNALNVVTGRLDEPGGAMFTAPAVDPIGSHLVGRGHVGRWRSRVRGLPEVGGELPVAALAEEMDTPGDGRVRALVTVAGNPVLSTPDGTRLARALDGLDTMVAVDFYLNETTRHAHLILPPTSPLERDHYDLVFNLLAVQNVAKFSRAVFPVPAGQLHDWEILDGLGWRMERPGSVARWRARAESGLKRAVGLRGALGYALRTGPRGKGWAPGRSGLTLRTLLDAPHGLVLGPLERCLPERLATRDGKVHLAPEELLRDVLHLARLLDAAPAGPETLLLIGRRDLRSNNSWMHNAPRLMKGADRCVLLMHPEDARHRSVGDGDEVMVRSRVGTLVVPVALTTGMARGVVSLPHGWGHRRPGIRLGVASAHPGASLNDLTDAERIDGPSGNAAFNGTPVTVVKASS